MNIAIEQAGLRDLRGSHSTTVYSSRRDAASIDQKSGSSMNRTYRGSCHCGRVKFEVDLDPGNAVVCDCSICTKKGVIINRVGEDQFRLSTPLDDLGLYQFNKRIAKHYYCRTCGIHTFNRPRSAPDMWAVNMRCLADLDLTQLEPRQAQGSKLD